YAKEIMPELNPNIALFPPVLLDNLTTSSYWRTVNKVPRHYINNQADILKYEENIIFLPKNSFINPISIKLSGVTTDVPIPPDDAPCAIIGINAEYFLNIF
ncbi:MAG: hypothetical protein ABIL40_09855, partial [candidate division WOR-3 bacterium]